MRVFEAAKTAAKLLVLDEKSLAIVRWILRRGDETLRLDYPLGPASVVFDVGGYRGDWAEAIASRFDCAIHVFEPVPQYCELIGRRLGANPKVVINNAGLGDATRRELISIDEEGSSVEKRSANTCEIQLLDVVEYFASRGVARVDLMKINIEGGEYALLARMHASGLIERCVDLQIQFHDFVPGAREKRRQLREILSRTHELTYDYAFIWENWHLKNA